MNRDAAVNRSFKQVGRQPSRFTKKNRQQLEEPRIYVIEYEMV